MVLIIDWHLLAVNLWAFDNSQNVIFLKNQNVECFLMKQIFAYQSFSIERAVNLAEIDPLPIAAQAFFK
jgi:hypothetical protein